MKNRDNDDNVKCPLCLLGHWKPGRLDTARSHIQCGRCSDTKNVRVDRVILRNGDTTSTPIAAVWSVQSSKTKTYRFSLLKPGEAHRGKRLYWTPEEFTSEQDMEMACLALNLDHVDDVLVVRGAEAEEIMKKHPVWESATVSQSSSGTPAPEPVTPPTTVLANEMQMALPTTMLANEMQMALPTTMLANEMQMALPTGLAVESRVTLSPPSFSGYFEALPACLLTSSVLLEDVNRELQMPASQLLDLGDAGQLPPPADDTTTNFYASALDEDLLMMTGTPEASLVPSDHDFSDIFDDDKL